MLERHWGVIIAADTWNPSDTVDGTSDETDDRSQPKLIFWPLYKPAQVGLGIGLITALPHMVGACERDVYPFTDRYAPLAELPDAMKSISSTSTGSVSASMVGNQPPSAYHSAAPSSSGRLIFESQIFELIPAQPEGLS